MSGTHSFMRKLKWPLDDFEALRQTHGCWDSGVFYNLSEAKRMGSSVYPPCVYADDPNFGPRYGEGCEEYGLCSFYFHQVLRCLNLRELDHGLNPLFAKDEHVVFDQPNGAAIKGVVCQVDRRMGEERTYFGSSWTYDIIAEVYEPSNGCDTHAQLFKHIPEWNIWSDDFAND